MTDLSLIVAYARNRTIGRDNALPWRLPADLAHFKRSTLGKPIIMGRKTWESLGRPLPGRLNLVVSRNANYRAEGATVVASLDEALAVSAGAPEAYVIGGEMLYRLALPMARRVVATEIDADIEGDAWFPALPAGWRETAREPQPEENGYRYAFVTYER
ncbi:dihydrofolate reductase [Verticiella sediminum]|uniref:Dihydrofolate reductase n=1 Tax=Verticiella sediminum TaxID=1247510 RepID=A0A556AIZ1_9BURK|nr:dihydrofolate reductase [Verticiella sediminum]TSH92874.1 dihydrofolate reductase [Verticiella sediminum]